jgi:hypothetical protein
MGLTVLCLIASVADSAFQAAKFLIAIQETQTDR